jgi:hypothetical protein
MVIFEVIVEYGEGKETLSMMLLANEVIKNENMEKNFDY